MITKTTMVVVFNLKNSHSLTFSFPTEEVFQVNGQNRPVANLLVVDFHSQPREMLTPKPLNTLFEKLAIAIDKCTMDPRALLNPEYMYLFLYDQYYLLIFFNFFFDV